jgi:hypothetical protein
MVLVQEQIRIAILPNLKQLLQDRGALWHGSKASAYTSQMYSIGTNDVGDAQRNAMQCNAVAVVVVVVVVVVVAILPVMIGTPVNVCNCSNAS